MTKAEIVRAWCEQRVGCPYIYGGTGKPCTPAYREARMNQYPAYAAKIKRNCPRLSGKATSCADCKWADPETGEGKLAYDCAQLSRWAMDAVGISLVSGANSQWQKTKWAMHGDLADLPNDLFGKVFLVFRYDADKGGMGHVGIYQGDGYVIHAKGHDYGVVRQKLSDVKFTHWGLPMGLYEEEISVADPTLRRGDSGEDVKRMQRELILLNYLKTGADDGEFGGKTEAAVRAFQKDQGIGVDGVCGPKTWAALKRATGHNPDDEPGETEQPKEPDEPGEEYVSIPKRIWDAIKACSVVIHDAVKDYDNVG